jgi:hypothetical protein
MVIRYFTERKTQVLPAKIEDHELYGKCLEAEAAAKFLGSEHLPLLLGLVAICGLGAGAELIVYLTSIENFAVMWGLKIFSYMSAAFSAKNGVKTYVKDLHSLVQDKTKPVFTKIQTMSYYLRPSPSFLFGVAVGSALTFLSRGQALPAAINSSENLGGSARFFPEGPVKTEVDKIHLCVS